MLGVVGEILVILACYGIGIGIRLYIDLFNIGRRPYTIGERFIGRVTGLGDLTYALTRSCGLAILGGLGGLRGGGVRLIAIVTSDIRYTFRSRGVAIVIYSPGVGGDYRSAIGFILIMYGINYGVYQITILAGRGVILWFGIIGMFL